MFDDKGELSFTSKTDIKVNKPLLGNYKVLIVDDEVSVHEVTKLALLDMKYEGHGLELLHAYSATEAEKILRETKDIAVILLDVVMESDSAGLDLVKVIREDLANNLVRVILRTGQPGQAPEQRVIVEYNINDYKNKTELTSQKLFSTMITALRSYSDLLTIERNKIGLKKVITSTSSMIKMKSMDRFFNGLLGQVISLTCPYAMQPDDSISAYVGFYQHDKLLFEAGTDHFDIEQTRKETLALKYKDIIKNVIEQKQNIKTDEYSIFYQLNEDKTALLLLLEGDVSSMEIEDTLFKLFITDAAITYDNLLLAQDIKESQKDTIFMLSELAEQRSKETGKHVKRVAYYCKEIGEEIGMNEDDVEMLFAAAPMHDIGKIAIRDAVLKKAGALTDPEFNEMKDHSLKGYELLKDSEKPLMQMAGVIAHEHHERFDGKGYPQGLLGEEIHIYGRIVALCDVFDALSSKRVYKEAWPLDQVYELLKDERGKQFDPKIVDAFFRRLEAILSLREVYKD
jgi:response regulator RpfG family c-di-GMP phosphodiesterase